MKKFLSICIYILLFMSYNPVFATILQGYVKTDDNINIAYNLYEKGHDEVVVLAHGWFMTKDSQAFSEIAKEFSNYYDVIVFDFRGHGKSSGKYTFGKNEISDISSIISYAKGNYRKVYLIGFSLGSLVSIDYCAHNNKVDKLILVSAPTDFKKIENNVLSPNAFVPTLKKFEWKRWTSIRFSVSSIFQEKIKPEKEIKNIKIPILFIAGENDPIIYKWHNEKLYNASNSTDKEQIVLKNGKHAEDLYLYAPKTFMDICLNWLRKS